MRSITAARTLLYLGILAFSLFAASCSTPMLSCRSDYFGKKNLASVIIDTPDPRKDTPYFGQRLFVQWLLPPSILKKGPCDLHINYRLRNGEEKSEILAVTQSFGSYKLLITGDDYTEKGGLLSYLVSIQQDGHSIAESRHKFWIHKIIVE